MKRALTGYLQDWLVEKNRKPLVMRGARQVGKTWIVRQLAETSQKYLIELNFEKQPELASLFVSNDPKKILLQLLALQNKHLEVNELILFLDEIQAAPHIFAKLRWFAEDLPELPVIAAGSLLEFILSEAEFSMPVGRITYAHLEPFSFEEYLLAQNKQPLLAYLQSYTFENRIPDVIHNECNNLFKEYLLIGGMPAIIAEWTQSRSLLNVEKLQQDLLATYRDDFSKYKGRIDKARFDEMMAAIPQMLGNKFVYSRVNSQMQQNSMRNVLSLLAKARVCHIVQSTAANGIPLGAEVNEKFLKVIFLDSGLCCVSLGIGYNQLQSVSTIELINQGGIAEQIVGQLLRTLGRPYIEPKLYYWRREETGSNAEVDYVIQYQNKLIPLEVKAGSTGGLKSLHLMMELKKLNLAVRINSDYPTITNVKIKSRSNHLISYDLISLPFYLLGQLNRLLEESMKFN